MCDKRFTGIAALAAVLALAPSAAAAQLPGETEVDREPVEGEVTPVPRLWQLRASVSGVLDNNIDRDDEDLTAAGTVARFGASLRNRNRLPTLTASYGLQAHSYSQTNALDRTTHSARAAHFYRDGRWMLETAVSLTAGLLTPEFPTTDQLSVMPRLQFRPNSANRIRVYAAYRIRRYRDADHTGSTSPFAGIEYRRRFGPWHYLDFSARGDFNRATVAARSYDRSSFVTSYTRQLRPGDRVRAKVEYRDMSFSTRTVPGSSPPRLRHDTSVRPALLWTHILGSSWTSDLEYSAVFRNSSDPSRSIDAHRATLTLTYRR